jgi:radical SAM superfamily enzyme YgiQ (UPF0313 family)
MRKNHLKVLLIAPRYVLSDKAQYTYTFPLGIAYISAVLKKANFDVSCLNINHYDGSTSEIVKAELDKKKYDIVATGHIGMGYPIVESIFKGAKEHVSKPKTILGGAIITSEPQAIFESLKPDFGVLGEGEDTILELLNCIENKGDFKKVNGIIYKDNNHNLIITSPRKPIENLDKIPFPDFEGFEFEKRFSHIHSNSEYFGNFYDFPRIYPVLASRGCPFHCTFCYHTLGEQYRERTIKNVIKEIKFAIEKYKINSISLYDDLFSYKKERIYEFCKEIKKLSEKASQKIKWTCQLSVLHVDRDILRTMKDAGCELISYGFESYSEDVLKSMKKPITPQQIDSAFKMTLEEKIGVQANFIFGDVAETTQTAKKTIDYWKKNCKGQVTLTCIQPYPGSAIYTHCLKKGIIKDKLDFIKNQMPKREFFLNMTDNMSDKEFSELTNTLSILRSSLTNRSKPIYVKKTGKNIYEILSKCPFCNKKNLYKNFYLKVPYFYSQDVICKNCNMRYFFVSPLFNILRKLNLIESFVRIYHKLVSREKRIVWQ